MDKTETNGVATAENAEDKIEQKKSPQKQGSATKETTKDSAKKGSNKDDEEPLEGEAPTKK